MVFFWLCLLAFGLFFIAFAFMRWQDHLSDSQHSMDFDPPLRKRVLTIQHNSFGSVPVRRGLVAAQPCSATCTCAKPVRLVIGDGGPDWARNAGVQYVPTADTVWLYSCVSEADLEFIGFPTGKVAVVFLDAKWRVIAARIEGVFALVALESTMRSPKGCSLLLVVPSEVRKSLDHLLIGAMFQILDSPPAPGEAQASPRYGAEPAGGPRAQSPADTNTPRDPGPSTRPSASAPSQARPRDASRTPHEILGVPVGATMEDVRSAYLQRAKEYHPDKVATLGDKLKAVAEEEFKAVQTAYEQLRNGRGTATQAAKQAPARDREESTPRERHGQPGHDLPELRFQGLKFGETPQQAHEILKQKWQFEEIDQNGLANYAGQLGGEKVTMQLTFTAITSRLWSVSVFTFFPRGEDLSILSYRMQRLADGISAKHGVGEIIEVGGPSDVLDQFPFEDLVYRSDCQVSRIEWQACNGTINLFLYHPHTGSGNYQPKVILSYNSGEYAVLAADEDEEVLAADLD